MMDVTLTVLAMVRGWTDVQDRGLPSARIGYTTVAGRYCVRTCMACDRPLTADHNDELCLKCLKIVWDAVPPANPEETDQ